MLARRVQPPRSSILPLKVTKHIVPGCDTGYLGVRTVVGRSTWQFTIESLLNGRGTKILFEHKWTILRPAPGLSWFTTDDPVIRLNYHDRDHYDFGGGTGSPGSEILLPLSPQHLMYTRIGHTPPRRGSVLSRDETQGIRRLVAEHAHRYIFAPFRDADIPRLRPRVVDDRQYRSEQGQWDRWHEEQGAAEKELGGDVVEREEEFL